MKVLFAVALIAATAAQAQEIQVRVVVPPGTSPAQLHRLIEKAKRHACAPVRAQDSGRDGYWAYRLCLKTADVQILQVPK